MVRVRAFPPSETDIRHMLRRFKQPNFVKDLVVTRGALVRRHTVTPAIDPPSAEFVALQPLRPVVNGDTVGSYEDMTRRRRRPHIDGALGWGLLVALPILCGGLYFGLIASDRYVSQSEFIVRSADGSGATRLASMVSAQAGAAASAGIGGGDSNAQIVVSFIESHDGMKTVDDSRNLRSLFSRSNADFLSAYPSPFRADSAYQLEQYFSQMIAVDYDPATGVIKLTTEAFRPEDAKAIGESLLVGAEAFVNRMDTRARQDAIRTASDQVVAAYKEVIQARAKLTNFREREKLIDPITMSEGIIKTVSDLASQSAAIKVQLSDLAKNAPASSQIAVLRSQVASIEQQIAAQQRKLVGPDGSMTPVLAEYQQLSLQQEFADRSYTVALEQAEAARLQASRQNVFIERISGPTLADYATEPRRLLMIMLVVVAAFSLFGMARWAARSVARLAP